MPVNNLNPQGEVNYLIFHNDWNDLGLLSLLMTLCLHGAALNAMQLFSSSTNPTQISSLLYL